MKTDKIVPIFTIAILTVVSVISFYLLAEKNGEISMLNTQHITDSTAYASLQDSLRMSEGREERAQATAEERLIWVGNLASAKDSLKQVNARLQKKLDKQQAKLDSVIADFTAKAQQAEAEMNKLNERIAALEVRVSQCQGDNVQLQQTIVNLTEKLHNMTAWRDYYKQMAARTILQKLFGSGKVPMPDMPEIAGL